MDLVVVLRRNTVAPATGADASSTTAPFTILCPRFCATAAGNPVLPGNGTTPVASAANATVASNRTRNFILLPLLPQGYLRPLRRRRHPPASAPADPRRPLHTRFRIPRRQPHPPPPLHPARYLGRFHIQGR